MFQIITTEYWENCLGKLAQHSPVLFILFACWFCYCISYCLIYSNKLGHLQRCSESRGPPTSGKQFVCIFLIQIKIQFLWFLKVYGTACSISKIFHPNSVAVAMLIFKQDCFEEKNKQKKSSILFIQTGRENTSISSPRPPKWTWLSSAQGQNLNLVGRPQTRVQR